MKREDKRIKRIIFWGALTVVCALIIFGMSHAPAEESSEMSGKIVKWLLAHGIGEKLSECLDMIVRKAAHMTEYFVFTLCMTNFLINIRNSFNLKVVTSGVLFSLLYAISDEVHQLFVAGRAGRVTDVLIDSVGVMAAVIVLLIIKKQLKEMKNSTEVTRVLTEILRKITNLTGFLKYVKRGCNLKNPAL